MCQQVPDSNVLPRLRSTFEIFTDFVLEVQLTFLEEQHNSGSNKLFADRADFVDRFRFGRSLQFDIGKAIAFYLDDLAIFDNCQRESRNMLPLHLGPNIVVYFVGPGWDRSSKNK